MSAEPMSTPAHAGGVMGGESVRVAEMLGFPSRVRCKDVSPDRHMGHTRCSSAFVSSPVVSMCVRDGATETEASSVEGESAGGGMGMGGITVKHPGVV